MSDFKDLKCWLHATELADLIYSKTRGFPKEEVFGLANQMRRCAVSVPSNIAEGAGRQHIKENLHFLHIARGSLYELETQAIIAHRQRFLTDEDYQKIEKKIEESRKVLSGYIAYKSSTKD
ncbi:MAG: hypothetical protein HBSAPP04_20810 [Ignavibacteriaceae bacterium]|nr:MAG: four helix bundle protein [Chlorobiota bacterium]GJQ33242.1 MAG: hypothetical protein HBSAPP04_20810 [Ignavibacteriaceae bacterium]